MKLRFNLWSSVMLVVFTLVGFNANAVSLDGYSVDYDFIYIDKTSIGSALADVAASQHTNEAGYLKQFSNDHECHSCHDEQSGGDAAAVSAKQTKANDSSLNGVIVFREKNNRWLWAKSIGDVEYSPDYLKPPFRL